MEGIDTRSLHDRVDALQWVENAFREFVLARLPDTSLCGLDIYFFTEENEEMGAIGIKINQWTSHDIREAWEQWQKHDAANGNALLDAARGVLGYTIGFLDPFYAFDTASHIWWYGMEEDKEVLEEFKGYGDNEDNETFAFPLPSKWKETYASYFQNYPDAQLRPEIREISQKCRSHYASIRLINTEFREWRDCGESFPAMIVHHGNDDVLRLADDYEQYWMQGECEENCVIIRFELNVTAAKTALKKLASYLSAVHEGVQTFQMFLSGPTIPPL